MTHSVSLRLCERHLPKKVLRLSIGQSWSQQGSEFWPATWARVVEAQVLGRYESCLSVSPKLRFGVLGMPESVTSTPLRGYPDGQDCCSSCPCFLDSAKELKLRYDQERHVLDWVSMVR